MPKLEMLGVAVSTVLVMAVLELGVSVLGGVMGVAGGVMMLNNGHFIFV